MGWVYFTVNDEQSAESAMFAVRPDGSGLRQIGNQEFLRGHYIGSVKRHLVFQDFRDFSFRVIREPAAADQ